MPKSIKTTATQGFYEGLYQLRKFAEKELGDINSYGRELQARREKVQKLIMADKLDPIKYANNRKGTTEVYREEIYAGYVQSIGKYEKKLGKNLQEKTVVDMDLLEELSKDSYNIINTNLFFNSKFKWGQDEASLTAINKFRDMVAANDITKYNYFMECFKKGVVDKDITLIQVLDSPVPKLREPEPQDKEDLKATIVKLAEKLEKADRFMHKNSAEFNAMNTAVISLKAALLEDRDDEIGGLLETLQATSMEYAKAKGVGLQSSTMGKIRMDTALDLCNVSSKYMSCYASKERIAEIEKFEKENFKTELTKDGVLKFVDSEFYKNREMETMMDKYKNDPLKKIGNQVFVSEKELEEMELDVSFE